MRAWRVYTLQFSRYQNLYYYVLLLRVMFYLLQLIRLHLSDVVRDVGHRLPSHERWVLVTRGLAGVPV